MMLDTKLHLPITDIYFSKLSYANYIQTLLKPFKILILFLLGKDTVELNIMAPDEKLS